MPSPRGLIGSTIRASGRVRPCTGRATGCGRTAGSPESFRGRLTGFTLVELVAALAIAALLFALAVPAFHDWLSAYQLANHARHLAESMTHARTEAVRRGHRVNLCKSSNRRQCDDVGSWNAGFLMYVDIDHDGKVGAGEPILGSEGPAPPGITVSANRPLDDYVSYTNLGNARLLNGALQMGTLTVCRSGQHALNVVLANSGRVRVEKTADRCP